MVKIYYLDISILPSENYDFDGFCEERIRYVNGIKDATRKKQSYYVWKLLLRALSLLGFDLNAFSFSMNKEGRWIDCSSLVNFSLSHSKNLVCVAICDSEISVDVELVSNKIFGVKKLLVGDNTKEGSCDYDEHLLTKKWTIFECQKKLSTIKNTKSFSLLDDNGLTYILSVGNNQIDFDCTLTKL